MLTVSLSTHLRLSTDLRQPTMDCCKPDWTCRATWSLLKSLDEMVQRRRHILCLKWHHLSIQGKWCRFGCTQRAVLSWGLQRGSGTGRGAKTVHLQVVSRWVTVGYQGARHLTQDNTIKEGELVYSILEQKKHVVLDRTGRNRTRLDRTGRNRTRLTAPSDKRQVYSHSWVEPYCKWMNGHRSS